MRHVALSGLALAALGVALSCRQPTQMKVGVTLDFDCSELAGNKVSLRTGSSFPGAGPAQTQSKACKDRRVGTAVLQPSGIGDRVAIEVVAALSPATLDNDGLCPEGAAGCIHARRLLAFVDGSLDVPIQLQKGCAGRTCGYDQTCVAAACVDASTLSGAVDAGADAAVVDAGTDGPTATNLLKDASFDLGCVGWSNYYSILADETEARSAPASCRVCQESASYFYVAQTIVRDLKAGQRFLAKAWVRSASGKTAPAKVGFVIEGTDAGDVVVEYAKGPTQPVSATWTEVQAVLDVTTSSATQMHVRIGPEFASPAECFIVDDASVVQLQ